VSRVLALDPGERRTGLALSDPTGVLATPLRTHDRRHDGSLLELVAGICAEHGVERVLVGHPLTQEGDRGRAAQHAEELARRLAAVLEVPVELVDERYTSQAADRVLAGRRRERGRRDAVAAAILLEGWLEAHREEGA
jgi:putative Holliday junction resolvase